LWVEDEAIACIRAHELGIAAVDVMAVEARAVAQVFLTVLAIGACSAGPAQPRNANAFADRNHGVLSGRDDFAHDLVARDDREREVGEFVVTYVQIRATNAAGQYAYHDIVGARGRHGPFFRHEFLPGCLHDPCFHLAFIWLSSGFHPGLHSGIHQARLRLRLIFVVSAGVIDTAAARFRCPLLVVSCFWRRRDVLKIVLRQQVFCRHRNAVCHPRSIA